MIGEQQVIRQQQPGKLMDDTLDLAIHDCMTTIWKAYRASVTSHNFKPYNACFSELYNKYPDLAVQRFIQGMGMGLVEAANRRIKNGN